MPYCNPKAPGEIQKLDLKTKTPPTKTTKAEEPIVESPTAEDPEERLPEAPPQGVCVVSLLPWLPLLISTMPSCSLAFVRWFEQNPIEVAEEICSVPCQSPDCKHCGRELGAYPTDAPLSSDSPSSGL